MQCNIDSYGARLRRVWGIMVVGSGVVLGMLNVWAEVWWLWVVVAGCFLAGGFAIFEAQKRWCVLRAMGVKTPN